MSERHPTGAALAALLPLAALLLALVTACSSPAQPRAGSRESADTQPGHPASSVAASKPSAPAGSGSVTTGGPPAGCNRATERVSTAAQLTAALANAKPGTTITMAPGVYQGDFVATASGTSSAPISLCGTRSAILSGLSVTSGYAFYLDHASWWQLDGFTVTGGQKGVMADASDYDVIYGLYVHGVGDEAIHLRSFSSHDVVSHNLVRDTGLHVQFYGEGIYVGSAHKNWCRYTGCNPDGSNDDTIIDNDIADTTAENIDIKEGTSGGTIAGNTLDGAGMVESAATAWINVKGNYWTIVDNVGVDSIRDGYQVHQVYPGWGIGNTFQNNKATLSGTGVGFYVQSHNLQTFVGCNNEVTGAQLSNLQCQST
ncbi:MAG: hypothetical protein ACRDOK_26995 [Streptosporangiaceae bacterium]